MNPESSCLEYKAILNDKLEIENRTFTKITGATRRLQKRMIDQTVPFEEAYLNHIQDTTKVTGQVTGQVKRLLSIWIGEKSRSELMSLMELKGRDNFNKIYLHPALKEELVEMTIPDKPNSRMQKYRLTPLGIELKRQLEIRKNMNKPEEDS